jgi:hypothetical protein
MTDETVAVRVYREDDVVNATSPGNVVAHTHVAEDISNSTETGRSIMTAASQSAARSTLGIIYGDVRDFGAVGDGVTDDTAAINDALATDESVNLGDGSYLISSALVFQSGNRLYSNARATITLKAGARFRFATISGLNDVRIEGIEIDGNQANLTGSADATIVVNGASYNVEIEDCVFRNMSSASTGAIVVSGSSYDVWLTKLRATDSSGTTFGVSSASLVHFRDIKVTGGTGFGVRFGEASENCSINGLVSRDTGLEGIGVTYNCDGIRGDNIDIEGAGDNGLSITGSNCGFSNVRVHGNEKAGIGVWGSNNTISCVRATNNNQSDSTSWSGIWFGIGFGGVGQNNSVDNCFCDDDQAVPTQYGGIRFQNGAASDAYTLWTAGASATAGDYFYYGLNVYQAAGSGTTGATPPTHTSGSVSDGTVTWAYINTFIGSAHASGNRVGRSNVVLRSKSGASAVYDNLSWKRNTYPLMDVLVASSALSGTSFTADNTIIFKKYERIEIIINGFSHSGGASANVRVELSGDNGSNWSTATTVSATVDAATLVGLHLFIDNTAASTGVRLTTTIAGTTAYANAFGNTINTGYINAVRISNSQGYTMDAGTYTVLGFGPIL